MNTLEFTRNFSEKHSQFILSDHRLLLANFAFAITFSLYFSFILLKFLIFIVSDYYRLQRRECRVCFETEKESEESLLSPCRCKGSIGYVHLTCLELSLERTRLAMCELCHHTYSISRERKLTLFSGLLYYLSSDNIIPAHYWSIVFQLMALLVFSLYFAASTLPFIYKYFITADEWSTVTLMIIIPHIFVISVLKVSWSVWLLLLQGHWGYYFRWFENQLKVTVIKRWRDGAFQHWKV